MRFYIYLAVVVLFSPSIFAKDKADCAKLLQKMKNQGLSKQSARGLASVAGDEKREKLKGDNKKDGESAIDKGINLNSFSIEKLRKGASILAKCLDGSSGFDRSETHKYIESETDKKELIAFIRYLDSAQMVRVSFKQLDTFVAMSQTRGYKWSRTTETCIEGDPTIGKMMVLMEKKG